MELEILLGRLCAGELLGVAIDGCIVDAECQSDLGGGEAGVEHEEGDDFDRAEFIALVALHQTEQHSIMVVEFKHGASIRKSTFIGDREHIGERPCFLSPLQRDLASTSSLYKAFIILAPLHNIRIK